MCKLPELGEEVVAEIEEAWAKPQEEWARRRLLVVRLIAQHELTVGQIMKVADVSRQTVFTYRDKVVEEGVGGLLRRGHGGGKPAVVVGKVGDELLERLAAGRFRSAREAQAFVRKRTRKEMSESGVRQMLRRLGGRLKTPRKSHANKAELPDRLTELIGPAAPDKVRVWVLDEHRYGLLPVLRRCWGLRGVRVHAPYATRYQWGYLHEALEVDGANDCQLLFTPLIDRDVHAIFLEQIGAVAPDAIHVVIADQAGFHLPEGDPRIPANIRLLRLPPYCPELNPVERFGGLLKAAVGNRLYSTLPRLERHLEAAARLWSRPERVRSLIHDWMALQIKPGATA